MAQGQEFFKDGCLVLGNVEKRMRMAEQEKDVQNKHLLSQALEERSEGTLVPLTAQQKLKTCSASLNHVLLHFNEDCCLL